MKRELILYPSESSSIKLSVNEDITIGQDQTIIVTVPTVPIEEQPVKPRRKSWIEYVKEFIEKRTGIVE